MENILKHFEKFGIKFQKIIFTSLKEKGIYAKSENYRYLIDDDRFYLRDCKDNGVIPLLYNERKDDNFMNFRSWSSIYDHLKHNFTE